MTNEDIVSLASIGNDTVFAVTAPQGTSLVVPDPDAHTDQGQPRQYRRVHPSPAAIAMMTFAWALRCVQPGIFVRIPQASS